MTPNQIIIKWALAHTEADKNPDLLLSARPVNFKATQEYCIRTMQDLELATKEMLALEGQSNLPKELLNLFEANKDKGCNECWASSAKKLAHIECHKKMNKWFGARNGLLAYGLDEYAKSNFKI